jgi:formyltetrahydrofolate deformylase
MGRDKTGVIARITQFLFQSRANIEALEEQVSRGQFSMVLQASWKIQDFDRAATQSGIAALGRGLGMEVRLHFFEPRRRQRMAVFVTRETHCLETILAACRSGRIKAAPALVIANRNDGRRIAARGRVPFHGIAYADRKSAERKILRLIDDHQIDFLVLARFMKILSPQFVWRYKNKIINIHPSLLPAFPGASAYRQAYEKGVKIIGVTAHFVTPDLDQGPIICQDALKVRPDESLASLIRRGQDLESKTLVRAIQLYLSKQLDVHWGKVHHISGRGYWGLGPRG